MKRLLAVLALSLLLQSVAYAQQVSLIPQTQGDVSFVSGGVGGDERLALQAMRADYNLSLLFSVKNSGEYLSEVKVRIEDAKGGVYLETVSDGPILYAKLKPGHYHVSATKNGYEIYKKASLDTHKVTALSFVWPQEKTN